MTEYLTLENLIGNTPLVRVRRLADDGVGTLLAKLEGNNPAGSVKDRPAYSMIHYAEARGDIRPGDVLVEATSGNTGIALAMVAAVKGYRMRLLMPENMTEERRAAMRAYGAEIVSVTKDEGMEGARDRAQDMMRRGEGYVLDQFANADNPRAHYEGTGPEIWRDTGGRITHFVATMGTTGTIMGTSRFLKERNPAIEVIGVQPAGESRIPGIRRWPQEYLPRIFEPERVDRVIEVGQSEAEAMTRCMATEEGLFAGISSGGAMCAALQVARDNPHGLVVTIVCDRGDRYLSSGVFSGRG